MERVIEVDLIDKCDLVEKYNEKLVSKDLIEYIISEAMYIPNKDTIKIQINKKFPSIRSCKNLIIEGLKREYQESLELHHRIDLKQYFFFAWGILALFLSTLVGEESMWKELLLIACWVPIWEMIDLEIFSDHDERKKRKVLKKLLSSEIVEN